MYKQAFVVVGPESTGSVFLAKTISYALGTCKFFGEWDGYGHNSTTVCEGYVIHRSIPYDRPKLWQTDLLNEVNEIKSQFQFVHYILTTRDKNISIESKIRRFGGSLLEANKDYDFAMPFFKSLARDDVFIWNYETMLLLGDAYFLKLYKFYGISSSFIPSVRDGNLPYIKRGGLPRIYSFVKNLF